MEVKSVKVWYQRGSLHTPLVPLSPPPKLDFLLTGRQLAAAALWSEDKQTRLLHTDGTV